MIPYALAAITLPTTAIIADKLDQRAIPILICLFGTLIGFVILLASTNTVVLVVGCCFVSCGSYPALVIASSWQMSTHAGFSKRATAWAMSQVFIQTYSIIATQIYTTPPRFFKGHGVLLGLNFVGVLALLLNYYLMKIENARRDKAARDYERSGSENPDNEKTYEELCDRHPQFRYAL